MGWYGDDTTCPNCSSGKAIEMFRNSMLESYYLVCTNCGLHLYAEYRQWVVTNSYIDKSVIGKNAEDIDPSEIVDEDKDEDVISKGSVL
jgi:transcription elongation factor Elf1